MEAPPPESDHPLDRARLARGLARTYSGDRDPWERVEEHQRVMDYAARHTSKGSAAIASALELPRARIRPWLDDGARPDPLRGVQAAERRGWLDLEYESAPFSGLNTLVAWIFSGGSIGTTAFVPSFALREGSEHEDRARLDRAFEAVGVGFECHHADTPGRATEARATADASALGRLLAALGAPVGEKNSETSLSLPTYLTDAPDATCRAFVETYVQNRGSRRGDRPGAWVGFREERPAPYRRALASLFDQVLGGGVSTSGANLYLSHEAAVCLGVE